MVSSSSQAIIETETTAAFKDDFYAKYEPGNILGE